MLFFPSIVTDLVSLSFIDSTNNSIPLFCFVLFFSPYLLPPDSTVALSAVCGTCVLFTSASFSPSQPGTTAGAVFFFRGFAEGSVSIHNIVLFRKRTYNAVDDIS